jgi:putative ABC transport system substrate-binding protein
MPIAIGRRELMAALGSAAVAWPLAAHAQQSTKKIRSLGLLLPGLPEASMGKATRDRLRELGYAEGRDILLQARLDELAVELANQRPHLLAAGFQIPRRGSQRRNRVFG